MLLREFKRTVMGINAVVEPSTDDVGPIHLSAPELYDVVMSGFVGA